MDFNMTHARVQALFFFLSLWMTQKACREPGDLKKRDQQVVRVQVLSKYTTYKSLWRTVYTLLHTSALLCSSFFILRLHLHHIQRSTKTQLFQFIFSGTPCGPATVVTDESGT